MENSAKLSLTSIFSDTDSISYGPFKIIKKTGQSYRQAQFFVQDQAVPLQPSQMKIMALLISQQGAPLTTPMVGQAMDTPGFKKLADQLNHASNAEEQDQVERSIFDNYRVHITKIRDALQDAFPPGPERVKIFECIETLGFDRRNGVKGPNNDPHIRSYKLRPLD